MKAVNKLLTLLMIVLFVFTSCGKDDPKTEYTFKTVYTSVSRLEGVVTPSTLTISGENKSLDDMLTGIDYAKPITSVELASKLSEIKITGLTGKGITLTDFTVSINGVERNLGTVTSDYDWSTNDDLVFLNTGLKKVVQDKKLDIKMKFITSKRIDVADNINLIIDFDGVYKYMK